LAHLGLLASVLTLYINSLFFLSHISCGGLLGAVMRWYGQASVAAGGKAGGIGGGERRG